MMTCYPCCLFSLDELYLVYFRIKNKMFLLVRRRGYFAIFPKYSDQLLLTIDSYDKQALTFQCSVAGFGLESYQ